MIEKSILKRIKQLECIYPVINFNVDECTKNIIKELEAVLQYEIKDRINLPKKHYFDMDTLYRDIFSFLSVTELRVIAYYNDNQKTE